MKPSIPQGTRDFSPAELRKRYFILDTLRSIFERYGFQPLETPAMEQLTTLMGKYGEEGDRLIFKILNNGLHDSKKKDDLNNEWTKILDKPFSTPLITERALRYDLTIPFARYVAMHQNDIALPFRRYQMQPVWRADRPQKGRYREFWQCDCDVVGSSSLINEAELLCIYRSAFQQLNIPSVCIKINSRKLLAALAELCDGASKITEITVALDKLDKIGWEGVCKELAQRDLSQEGIAKIEHLIQIKGSNEELLEAWEQVLGKTDSGAAGIAELRKTLAVHEQLSDKNWTSIVQVDLSLARGLNYYTGVIMEVTTTAVKMGSIGGGGRYDDLTGLFGLPGITGVGVSFGIDRIYDVMEELAIFPVANTAGSLVMLLNFGGKEEAYALQIVQQLRHAGIAAELYPEAAKMDKQMKYANKRNLPYIIIAGEQEIQKGQISLKDMRSGQQELLHIDAAIKSLTKSAL